MEPLSRQRLNEFVRAMRPGLKVVMLWRFAGRAQFDAHHDGVEIEEEEAIPFGPVAWENGEVVEVSNEGAVIMWPSGMPHLDTEGRNSAAIPFPPQPTEGWNVEVLEVRLKRQQETPPTIRGTPSRQHQPTPQQNAPAAPTQPTQTQGIILTQDAADAIRGEGKKQHLCVGLKIPFVIQSEYAPFYLALYVQRIAKGESAADIANEWVAHFDDSNRRLGVDQKLSDLKRPQLFQKRDATGHWLRGMTPGYTMPNTKDGFTDMFDRGFDLFSIAMFGLFGNPFEDSARNMLMLQWKGDSIDFRLVHDEMQKKSRAHPKQRPGMGPKLRGRGNPNRGRGFGNNTPGRGRGGLQPPQSH